MGRIHRGLDLYHRGYTGSCQLGYAIYGGTVQRRYYLCGDFYHLWWGELFLNAKGVGEESAACTCALASLSLFPFLQTPFEPVHVERAVPGGRGYFLLRDYWDVPLNGV